MKVLEGTRDPKLAVYLFVPLLHEKTAPEVRAAAEAAVARLLGTTPTRPQAARQLAARVRQYLDRPHLLAADASGQATVWSWDETAKQPVPQTAAADQAGRSFAARLARDAWSLLPEDTQVRRLYLVAMLEEAAYQTGLDRPLPRDKDAPAGKAAALGVQAVEDALAYAMEHGHDGAAAAAAQVLGWQPGTGRLLHRQGQPCPLVQATRYPNPRVRLAAVEAIVRIEPQQSYPGASRVLEAIGFFIASKGSRRAIVASPTIAESQRISGYLAAMGLEMDWARSGRDLMRLAQQSPDYELVMIDAGIDRPTLDFVVQELRRDGRTALVPVGIFARDDQFDQARHVAEKTPRAEAFYRPHEQAVAQWQVDRILAMAGPRAVGAAERRRQAAMALQWLDALCHQPSRRIYDLRRVEAPVLSAMNVPGLSTLAAAVLANLGTAESQRTLVDVASRSTAPAEDRTAALSAFRRSTQQYGILLTIPQIRLQYDRYNQSANQDAATQKILGLILDCIEAPTQAAGPSGHGEHQQGSTAASVMR
jgi:CheY-like chemotaxis protein